MNDLWAEIESRLKLLDSALHEVSARGQIYARAESDYHYALASEMLRLKADGTPATMVRDVAIGTEKVARLRLDRDCKEALYKAALEAIQVYKLQIRVLENQLQREWTNYGTN